MFQKIFERWRWLLIFILSLSFFFYFSSFLYEFHLRHSEDGADFNIFILSLSLSHYFFSLSIFVLRIHVFVIRRQFLISFIIYSSQIYWLFHGILISHKYIFDSFFFISLYHVHIYLLFKFIFYMWTGSDTRNFSTTLESEIFYLNFGFYARKI